MGVDEDNVKLVKQAYDAWNRNDWDELAEVYHADIHMTAPPGFMEPSETHGWPELRARYLEVKDAWKHERIELEEATCEADMVAARVCWAGVGIASDAPISLDVTNLVRIRGGRIIRLEYFWDYAEAVREMHERVAPDAAPSES